MSTETISMQVYRETDAEHNAPYLKAGRQAPPRPDAQAAARDALDSTARASGKVLLLNTMSEAEVLGVVVDENADWRPSLADETPTGHITTWTAEVRTREDAEASEPSLAIETDGSGCVIARVPESHWASGGAARIIHGMSGGEIDVAAYDANDQPIAYLFWTDTSPDELVIEFAADTRWFRVSPLPTD